MVIATTPFFSLFQIIEMPYVFGIPDWSFIFGLIEALPIVSTAKLLGKILVPPRKVTAGNISALISSLGFLFLMIQFQLLNTQSWTDSECLAIINTGNVIFPLFWTASIYSQSYQVQLLPAPEKEKKLFDMINYLLLLIITICNYLACFLGLELFNFPDEQVCFAEPNVASQNVAMSLTVIQLVLVSGTFIYRMTKSMLKDGAITTIIIKELAMSEVGNAIISFLVFIITMILGYQPNLNINWTFLYIFQNMAVFMTGCGYMMLPSIRGKTKRIVNSSVKAASISKAKEEI